MPCGTGEQCRPHPGLIKAPWAAVVRSQKQLLHPSPASGLYCCCTWVALLLTHHHPGHTRASCLPGGQASLLQLKMNSLVQLLKATKPVLCPTSQLPGKVGGAGPPNFWTGSESGSPPLVSSAEVWRGYGPGRETQPQGFTLWEETLLEGRTWKSPHPHPYLSMAIRLAQSRLPGRGAVFITFFPASGYQVKRNLVGKLSLDCN